MKKIFLVLITILIANSATADSGITNPERTQSMPASTPPKEENILEARITALSQAMIKADAVALKDLTATELSYGHSSGRVETQTTFIDNLLNGSSDFITIELQNQDIQLIDDIGIVRHTLAAETNDSGKPGIVKIGVMLVWKKSADEWKLLARQAFKL